MQFGRHTLHVMAGHSRSKNGVLKDTYDPAIHAFLLGAKAWTPGTSPGVTAVGEV
jgi:hypothetical protein